MKKYIPNTITLLNLLSGSIGIVYAINGELRVASWLVGLAAIFDFLDGFAARLLNVKSEIGKELDSLADVISFGLLPGTIIYSMLWLNPGTPQITISDNNIFPFIGLLIPVFSAIRLAKFNIDQRQTYFFLGLPTPANGLLIASFPLILIQNSNLIGTDLVFYKSLINSSYFLISLVVLLCWLLISEIPLMSLKFKTMQWKGNELRYTFVGTLLILLILLNVAAVPLIVLLYILLSLIFPDSVKGGIST
ncbi:MAG: CDP-diacylglycerol--serine O-phosphatidyltransferase [Bacteroidales bacterium]|nr:CDP-diacylglycerol--serine O-phosphatidyltransferase [Bacteroidales bacterium]